MRNMPVDTEESLTFLLACVDVKKKKSVNKLLALSFHQCFKNRSSVSQKRGCELLS